MAGDGWGNSWKLITPGTALVVVTAVVRNRKNIPRRAPAACAPVATPANLTGGGSTAPSSLRKGTGLSGGARARTEVDLTCA